MLTVLRYLWMDFFISEYSAVKVDKVEYKGKIIVLHGDKDQTVRARSSRLAHINQC